VSWLKVVSVRCRKLIESKVLDQNGMVRGRSYRVQVAEGEPYRGLAGARAAKSVKGVEGIPKEKQAGKGIYTESSQS
jgi:hypothetical protein